MTRGRTPIPFGRRVQTDASAASEAHNWKNKIREIIQLEIDSVVGGLAAAPKCKADYSISEITYNAKGEVTGWKCVPEDGGAAVWGTVSDWADIGLTAVGIVVGAVVAILVSPFAS